MGRNPDAGFLRCVFYLPSRLKESIDFLGKTGYTIRKSYETITGEQSDRTFPVAVSCFSGRKENGAQIEEAGGIL